MPTETLKAIYDVEEISAFADMHVVAENWVGALQHALIHFDAPPAEYRFTEPTGPAHEPVFACACTAAGHGVHSHGPSKKAAKRNAAAAWVKLYA